MTAPAQAFALPDSRTHLALPTAAFLLLVAAASLSGLDLQLADRIYAWGGSTWKWRDAWLTETLIHSGGRDLIAAMALTLLTTIGMSFHARWRYYRTGLSYVLVSFLLSTLLVNILKRVTTLDCPWDLTRYGGDHIYHSLLSSPFAGGGNCFPAGHASAGYAWFGLYFFALNYFPQWRRAALSIALFLGLVFGIDQQFRGAHFLTHDLWTAWLCWMCAYLLARRYFRNPTHQT
jgi:membrane-associated PAP2 superfamily phosphatase